MASATLDDTAVLADHDRDDKVGGQEEIIPNMRPKNQDSRDEDEEESGAPQRVPFRKTQEQNGERRDREHGGSQPPEEKEPSPPESLSKERPYVDIPVLSISTRNYHRDHRIRTSVRRG